MIGILFLLKLVAMGFAVWMALGDDPDSGIDHSAWLYNLCYLNATFDVIFGLTIGLFYLVMALGWAIVGTVYYGVWLKRNPEFDKRWKR